MKEKKGHWDLFIFVQKIRDFVLGWSSRRRLNVRRGRQAFQHTAHRRLYILASSQFGNNKLNYLLKMESKNIITESNLLITSRLHSLYSLFNHRECAGVARWSQSAIPFIPSGSRVLDRL
jgi:hypothetical protein